MHAFQGQLIVTQDDQGQPHHTAIQHRFLLDSRQLYAQKHQLQTQPGSRVKAVVEIRVEINGAVHDLTLAELAHWLHTRQTPAWRRGVQALQRALQRWFRLGCD